ncbi:hypothetical protein KFL_002190350 [Klebsormidium nitens]|uniref:Uncharacterized protein n=1 Tax=Klebsormidium nitens TaxID=105231 RepID=A0A1Y1I3L8_KLENI|nr:hypothetical protein KFL_002190350 [Klebsormidium nitens]|eukprot:GAQ85083.1 hypothetical protein KFL_002190350 [Klebsormidium nitens]
MYETTMIEAYDSLVTGNGYNQAEGGQGFTPETFRLKALPKSPWKTKGEQKRVEDGDLPKNIHFHKTVWGEGYHATGRKDGKAYSRYYMSIHETIESKLERAKAWLEYFEREGVPPEEEPAKPPTIPAKRQRGEDAELPRGISSVHNNRKKGIEEGYTVNFYHKAQRYTRQFVSARLTMEDKLDLAKEWLEKRSTETHKDPHSALHNAIDASITGLHALRRHAKGEMKRRLDATFRDILSYYLAMGPYPEELGL